MSNNKKIHITAIVAFAWCFGIIAIYYVSHKPFSPELALNMLLVVWRVMVGSALVGLAGGVGWLIYRDNTLNPLAQLALQMAIGLGFLALLFLLIGMTIGLPRLLPLILLIGLLTLTHKAVRAWFQQFAAFRELWQASDGFSRALAGLMGTMLLSAMLLALAPPVKFDALVYHLLLPDAYLRAGRVEYLPWIMKTGMPQTAEMLYTWAMALSGAAGAAVMGWVAGFVTILGLLGYLFQRLGSRPAWVGVASLLAGFTMPVAISWAYVDWWCLMFGFGALVSLDQWRQFGGVRPLVIAGLMAGFALGTKYPAGVLGLAAGVTLIWHAWRRREQFLRIVWPFAVPAILVPLPWLVKNLATTGNPLYPLFFESGAMDAVRHNVYQVIPPYGSWQDLVFLPFWATYMGHEGAEGYGAAIGPLLLALGAVAWLGNQQRTLVHKIAFENAVAISLSGLVVWAIGNQFSGFLIQSRFYFSIFPAFVFLAASGFLSLSSVQLPHIRLGRILSALVLLVLSLNTIDVGLFTLRQHAPQAVLGIESDETYLAHNLGWYQPAMEALVELPQTNRVLLLLEPRGFYCQPHCEPDETLDRWKRDWLYITDPAEILQSWREEGFTHVLYYQTGANYLNESGDLHFIEEEWKALSLFLADLEQIGNFGNAYLLYDIREQ
jgi:hypothetical protein